MKSSYNERTVSPVEIYSFDISQPRNKTASLDGLGWRDILDDIVGSKSRKSLSKKTVRPDPPRIDNSYMIDTLSAQYSECPKCFNQIPLRKLRVHLSSECSENIVVCPEPGCGLRMPGEHLKEHRQKECLVVRKRRQLVKAAKQRQESTLSSTITESISYELFPRSDDIPMPPPKQYISTSPPASPSYNTETTTTQPEVIPEPTHTQCTQCDEFIPNNIYADHQTQYCAMRLVYCTNRSLGCLHEVPLRHMRRHISEECAPEKWKEVLIARSKMRREVIQCSGCGEDVSLIELKKHNADECINRKVPCRNALLGCNVMVRLRDRKLHEHVDGKAVPRPCLYLNGGCGHVSINEDDITPSWTMQFWIYRPSVLESARSYLRECRRLCGLFHEAAIAEHNMKSQLKLCKQRLVAVTEAMHADRRASKGHLLGQTEIGEITVMLANLVTLYEDTALICVSLAAMLRVALNAALADVDTLRILEDRNSESGITEVVKGTPCYHPPADDESTVGEVAVDEQIEWTNTEMPSLDEGVEIMQSADIDASVSVTRSETFPESLENMSTCVTSVSADNEGDVEVVAEDTTASEEAQIASDEQEESQDNEIPSQETQEVEDSSLIGDAKVTDDPEPSIPVEEPTEADTITKNGDAEKTDIEPPSEAEKFSDTFTRPDVTVDTEVFAGEVVDMEALQSTHVEELDGITFPEEIDPIPEEIRKLRMNPLLFDWDTPKTWVRWRDHLKDMMVKLSIDEETLEKWRYECGILKKAEEQAPPKSPKKKEKKGMQKRKIDASLRVQTRLESETKLRQKLIQGSDILAFSDDVQLSLCLDGTDAKGTSLMGTIGFIDAKSGKRSFYTRIAREKWTHVCIVCSTTPFPSLLLYSDGLLVGAIKDTTYNLPMQCIGAPNLSYLGYILDIRYWSRPRSTQEIRLDLHALIDLLPTEEPIAARKRQPSDSVSEATETTMTTVSDNADTSASNPPPKSSYVSTAEPDMTSRNLIAWWPMEDGQMSTKIVDVTEHRFASVIIGKYGEKFNWIEAETLLKDDTDALPIPSFREKSLCPYEVRRFRLAMRGRALYKSTRCPACDMKVKVHALRAHVKDTCPKRLVPCRFDFCGASFPLCEQVLHESKYCAHTKKRDAMLERRIHDKATCPLCSIEVKLASLEHHMATKCVHRTVTCPNKGCDMKVSYILLNDHIKFHCCSPQIRKRMWMIEHARRRKRYPRPWGIEMEYTEHDGEAAEVPSEEPLLDKNARYETTLDAEFKATSGAENDSDQP